MVESEASIEAGLALLASGIFLSPSVGNLVQGNTRGALVAGGLRAGGVALAYAGALAVYADGFVSYVGAEGVFAGLGMYAAGVVSDVISASGYRQGASMALALDPSARAPVLVVHIGL